MTDTANRSAQLIDSILHVEDSGGTGRVVVLIHGWPLSSASWREQIPVLEQAGYRVITYDRRGFGQSDKTQHDFDYNTLTEDLESVLSQLDLTDVTLVGFSMGGGEVARYISKHGTDRLRSVVFASAVTPYMMHSPDNPEGPLTASQATEMTENLSADAEGFYDDFTKKFFSAHGVMRVTEQQRQQAIAQCDQADMSAALACLEAFGTTDFRDDLVNDVLPTLVLHGDSDAIVPYEGSGKRTLEAIPGSELGLIEGAPHGCNVSHAAQFNEHLLAFLAK